jgi:ureidoacrylate peracid hydrolase
VATDPNLPTALVPLEEKIDPRHTALLVVDLQNDFCADGCALARTGADMGPPQAAARRMVELIDVAREVGVLPIFVRLIGDPVTETAVWVDQRIRRAGAPYKPWATADSHGAAFYLVVPRPGEPVVDKYRYASFQGTKLEFVLRRHGIRTLVVGGVATNVCVETAVREAFVRDLYVVLVRDACAGTSQEAHDAAIENLGRFFCQVVDAEEVRASWRAGRPARASMAAASASRGAS